MSAMPPRATAAKVATRIGSCSGRAARVSRPKRKLVSTVARWPSASRLVQRVSSDPRGAGGGASRTTVSGPYSAVDFGGRAEGADVERREAEGARLPALGGPRVQRAGQAGAAAGVECGHLVDAHPPLLDTAVDDPPEEVRIDLAELHRRDVLARRGQRQILAPAERPAVAADVRDPLVEADLSPSSGSGSASWRSRRRCSWSRIPRSRRGSSSPRAIAFPCRAWRRSCRPAPERRRRSSPTTRSAGSGSAGRPAPPRH